MLPPLLAAAVALVVLWPMSWFLMCGGDDCHVTGVTSAVGVPLPTGALSAVPAVAAAGLLAPLVGALVHPGRRLPLVVAARRALLPLLAALAAVVLLYPVSPWSQCDDLDLSGQTCRYGATSITGIPLPGAAVGTLPAAAGAGLAWWAVARVQRRRAPLVSEGAGSGSTGPDA